jgi:hypothetical protein
MSSHSPERRLLAAATAALSLLAAGACADVAPTAPLGTTAVFGKAPPPPPPTAPPPPTPPPPQATTPPPHSPI